jgi:hypothetical protein
MTPTSLRLLYGAFDAHTMSPCLVILLDPPRIAASLRRWSREARPPIVFPRISRLLHHHHHAWHTLARCLACPSCARITARPSREARLRPERRPQLSDRGPFLPGVRHAVVEHKYLRSGRPRLCQCEPGAHPAAACSGDNALTRTQIIWNPVLFVSLIKCSCTDTCACST